MRAFSLRTQWARNENFLARKTKQLRETGTPLWDLSVSNPTLCDFKCTNFSLYEGAKNKTYIPHSQGILETREAIATYYGHKNQKISPEDIFITANTSEAYSFIFKLLMDAGDKLLVPAPSYPLIDYLVSLHDVEIVRYPLLEDQAWCIDFNRLQDLMSDQKIKAVLTVHPNNPTGNYLSEREINELSGLCRKNQCALIADEVFHDFSLEKESFPSFAGTPEVLTFTLSGISKILAQPQMKLSWLCLSGPRRAKEEAKQRLEIIADAYLSASTPVQNSLPGWLESRTAIGEEIIERIQRNLSTLRQACQENTQMKSFAIQGGWSAVLKMPNFLSDEAWAEKLLEEAHTLVHPGYYYDFENDSFLVVSLIVSEKTFQEGISRMLSTTLAVSEN